MKYSKVLIVTGMLIIFPVILMLWESYSLSRHKYAALETRDTLSIYFIHASLSFKKCPDSDSRYFPYEWGHVAIGLDSFMYGFEYLDKNSIHFLPKKEFDQFNAKFFKKDKDGWWNDYSRNRITMMEIPIGSDMKNKAMQILDSFIVKTPYDYAFLGMRCASATYQLLGEIGVIPRSSDRKSIRCAFYPGHFRMGLIRWAKNNGLPVHFQRGSDCRYWD